MENNGGETMKVITQLGQLDISPESVTAIKKVPVMPELVNFSELTHCVEFDSRFYDLGDQIVCISEADAGKLAELSGVELEGKEDVKQKMEVLSMKNSKTVFVPFPKQFVLNQWEEYFDASMAWKKRTEVTLSDEASKEPEQTPAPQSDSSQHKTRTLYEEHYQPRSPAEQVFMEQYNCIECGRRVYDDSQICSGCIGEAGRFFH